MRTHGTFHGTWLLPKLGLTGIGVATSLVYLLSFIALYCVARRDRVLAPILSLRIWEARRATVSRLLRLGLPIAATYGSEAGFFSAVAFIIGSFGAPALAAHAVVNQLVLIVFQLTIGLSHAASIGVSAEVARGRSDAAARVGHIALIHGIVLMSLIAGIYLLAPGIVLGLFIDAADRATLQIASSLLAVAALLQFFDCAQNIGVGLMRGLDDTAAGFRMTLIGYWFVGLPAAWLFGQPVGLGPLGVWLGLLCGLAVTAALLLRRFATSVVARTAQLAHQ